MKTTIKTKLVIGTLAVTLGTAFLIPMAGHAMRVEALDDTWGKPVKVEKLENGNEIRYFEFGNPGGLGLPDNEKYRAYEVQKDGKVVDQGFAKKN